MWRCYHNLITLLMGKVLFVLQVETLWKLLVERLPKKIVIDILLTQK